ncbi:hypothetical protein N658DRAFT_426893 [Parathielavia hyrcaniae]|uniref:Kelch repeat-containing protein n=1 Tax=Parathielavia hyrcaniae TaxID=113614 RepID=A0AAN6T1M7_9PEZI|nr:hypothetical protein N658DRAFT_426893 [Parathielavia hyrcaniae]
MSTKINKPRKSIFTELGLDADTDTDSPSGHFRFATSGGQEDLAELTVLASRTTTHTSEPESANHDDNGSDDGRDIMNKSERQQMQQKSLQKEDEHEKSQADPTAPSSLQKPWSARLGSLKGKSSTRTRRPRIQTASSAPPPSMSTITRLSSLALFIAVLLPGLGYRRGHGDEATSNVADAGVTHTTAAEAAPVLEPRASSDSDNNFLELDLTKSWDTSSPAWRSLPQEPSGPPAVSLGYLWNDYNNLYLYGGQFADNPFVRPAPVSTWRYSISSQTWTEYPSPRTAAGKYADAGGDQPVQRAAEGAGISVPELGLSWYFGGHLDMHTTPSWSNQIARVYLKSLLEFTHPGYTNDAVYSLADRTGAGEGGAYRNITEGGLQAGDAFPERADGVLVFVPGWGEKGVLIGLAGGSNNTFVDDLWRLDVYDIATSEWYHQETTGEAPSVRVNPCAVTASAPDASSFQIYLYGGQNLVPYREQVQYSDMYILTIPAFVWIKVPVPPDNPPARAGHTCTLRDGQIIIVGGYTGNDPSRPSESPLRMGRLGRGNRGRRDREGSVGVKGAGSWCWYGKHGGMGSPPPLAAPVTSRFSTVGGGSTSSTERMLDGQEPSFFSVVLGPRRALRVVNGLEGDRDNSGE